MDRIQSDTSADLFFQINWSSGNVRHSEAFIGLHVNFWRDMLPGALHRKLMGKQPGDRVRLSLSVEELLGAKDANSLQTIQRKQFDGGRIKQKSIQPRQGRFYPQGILNDMPGIFKANKIPFRCIGMNNGHLKLFLGHPLAGRLLDSNVTVGTIHSKPEERGGTVRNWGEIITQGSGMQARWNDQPTDFFSDRPFQRKDESPDVDFYDHPRLVHHIDDAAEDMVRQLYSRFLADGVKVLDLMSSWQSHLPESPKPGHVAGLGLQPIELERNERLHTHVVQDLNSRSELPFKDNSFDVVLCSLSVEYLTRPFEVFREVARVLKNGGFFVTAFSNRWFEPKAIRIWTELHEFERMGLVLEYFRRTRGFEDMGTYSLRGLPRPAHDKYYGQIASSDPVYAVWGRKR